MRIMGIDGSLSCTGVAVVEDNEVLYMDGIASNNKDDLKDRIYLLQQTIKELIDKYKPQVIVIEDVFMYMNSKTVIDLARLNGALLALCSKLGVKVILYPPSTHKKASTGDGRATKDFTIRKVEEYFNITVPYLLTAKGNIKKKNNEELKNDNIADALSLCCCYLKSGGDI
jgi:crossover junction endodeoxyribonuclease RuvC